MCFFSFKLAEIYFPPFIFFLFLSFFFYCCHRILSAFQGAEARSDHVMTSHHGWLSCPTEISWNNDDHYFSRSHHFKHLYMPDIYIHDFISSPQPSWKVGIITLFNKWEHSGSEVKPAQLGRGNGSLSVWSQSLYLYDNKHRWESNEQMPHSILKHLTHCWGASLVTQLVKNLPAI